MITKSSALAAVEQIDGWLADYRVELESPSVDHERTQFLRGRIDALVSVVDAAQEKPPE